MSPIYDISLSFRTSTSKNLELARQSSFVILLVDARDKERYAILEELSAKDLKLYHYYNGTDVVF